MNENISTENNSIFKKVDVNQFTLEQCQQLLKDLPKRVLKLEREKDLIVFKQLEQVANNFGIENVDDFFQNYSSYKKNLNFKRVDSKPKRKVKIKYVNPLNKNETWTGLGYKPTWLAEGLKSNSFTLEDCEVKNYPEFNLEQA